jgi:hypothetical protein
MRLLIGTLNYKFDRTCVLNFNVIQAEKIMREEQSLAEILVIV